MVSQGTWGNVWRVLIGCDWGSLLTSSGQRPRLLHRTALITKRPIPTVQSGKGNAGVEPRQPGVSCSASFQGTAGLLGREACGASGLF